MENELKRYQVDYEKLKKSKSEFMSEMKKSIEDRIGTVDLSIYMGFSNSYISKGLGRKNSISHRLLMEIYRGMKKCLEEKG
jgi:hypothetical protein